jgi:Transposase IS4
VPSRRWHIKTPIGDHLSFGSNITKRMSRQDVFLLMFPPNQLDVMCRETNIILDFYHKPKTTKSELLKFFGIIILATRYEFQSRRNLWSEKPTSKYLSAPAFGSKTGMSRKRFDVLWSGVRWSQQPNNNQPGNTQQQHERVTWDKGNEGTYPPMACLQFDYFCQRGGTHLRK